MALPNGTITMNQVNVELVNPGTSQISLNDTDVRDLAERPNPGTPLSGGTSYAPGDGYTYFVFTSSGTFTSTGPTLNTTAEVIAVGGGGGGGGGSGTEGGSREGGGGGAGGYLRQPVPLSGSFSVPFVIGSGGAGGSRGESIAYQGSNGANTTLALPSGTITAGYGGGGGAAISPDDGADAGRPAPLGSGGGAANRGPGRGSPYRGIGGPQGNPGGYNDGGNNAAGGGGAGSAGRNSNNPDPGSTLSWGGAGISVSPLPYNNLPGVRKDFAGGGGGATGGNANPIGGGGRAQPGSGSGDAAAPSSGGGGGGGFYGSGGDGGPGIIIMRVSTSAIPSGGEPTISMSDLQGKSGVPPYPGSPLNIIPTPNVSPSNRPPNSSSSTAMIAVGTNINGKLLDAPSSPNSPTQNSVDHPQAQWFKTYLQSNRPYRVDMYGLSPASLDTWLGLCNSAGNIVAYNDDGSSSPYPYSSRIDYSTPPTGAGFYYIACTSYNHNSQGTFYLSIIDRASPTAGLIAPVTLPGPWGS